jgi:hypothetical protein
VKNKETPEDSTPYEEYMGIEKRRLYKDFWLFNYTNRHFVSSFPSALGMNFFIESWFTTLDKLIYKYAPQDFINLWGKQAKTRNSSALNKYNIQICLTFANALVYRFHRQHMNDGFFDLLYEIEVKQAQNPIEKLTSTELNFVKEMHELTLRYGFLAFSLFQDSNSSILWDAFVEHDPDDFLSEHIRTLFPYPKNGLDLKGLQIHVKPYDFNCLIDWDCVVYYKEKTPISHIRQALNATWDEESKQVIGDANDFQIAFYINRNITTKRYILRAIDSQVFHSELHQHGRVAFTCEDELAHFWDQKKPSKRLRSFYPGMTTAVTIGDDLIEKHRGLENDNVRRAIGLYHWDKVKCGMLTTKSRTALFSETIEKLQETKPELLNYYHTEFNFPHGQNIRGNTAEVHSVVISEMKEDFYVAKACIKNAEYLSNEKVKKLRKKRQRRR